MAGFSSDERHPVFPVFILLDVSYSMDGPPIEALNKCLPELRDMIMDDPQVGEIARICIMTFSDTAKTVLPLSDIAEVSTPLLAPESGTNFAVAFEHLRGQLEQEIRTLGKGTRFYKPVVFFMSDGDHIYENIDWERPLKQVIDKTWPFNPEIVTFGFAEANAQALSKIATRHAFLAKNGSPVAQVKEIMSALQASIRTTSRSFSGPQGGGLTMDVDESKFTQLPVLEL